MQRLIIAVILVGPVCAVLADEPLPLADLLDRNLRLVLEGALRQEAGDSSDLTIELQVRGGTILPTFVRGRGMTQGRHLGKVKTLAVDDGTMSVEVEMTIQPDYWRTGGRAVYTIEVTPRKGAGALSGSYSGTYTPVTGLAEPAPLRVSVKAAQEEREGLPPEARRILGLGKRKPEAKRGVAGAPLKVEGRVTGRLLPPWPRAVPGHVPLEAGEHPRLLFRNIDVERLRERASTPEGRAIMARFWKVLDYDAHDDSPKFDSWPAIGYGFAWQMSGEKKYADRAREIVEAKFFQRHPLAGQDIHHGPMLQGLALTFDLCYEAWDEDFRTRCIDEIWQRSQELITGTAAGTRMGGLNLAYWSNHNGIRVAAAGLGALAVWKERTSEGAVLDAQALAIVEEAAFDARGWIEDGCGGGAWFMEGLFYKGMTLVRGLAHFLHAYPVAMGQRIVPAGGEQLIAGHFLEARPGMVAVGLGPGGTLSGASGIDADSWGELIWTIGLSFVPDDVMPGIKYLHTRAVGLLGDETFGLARGCYAPYLLASYPFAVEEQVPVECFPWMSPDPVNGHWVFRPVWKDEQDILLTWNMLTHVRRSCHYERVGPALHWELRGFGSEWLRGRFQPIVRGKESVLASDPMGSRLVEWSSEGRTSAMTFDLTPAYMPLLKRTKKDETSWEKLAQQAGGLRAIEVENGIGMRADMGISGTRYVAVDGSGASGAPLLVAVVDDIRFRSTADGALAPAAISWRLPLSRRGIETQGARFVMNSGQAVLHGVVLGGGEVAADGTVEAREGKVFAVFALEESPAGTFHLEGEGIGARVTLGKRTVRFGRDRLLLE